ncbi:MAG TPA: right-handed parallel beta-helix repeat-containing protein [Xanthomonadaceae bacterium]|nr:right-handed parallel beta-helix repeat-containing protein [Xanthomonadaceae bacterium]
MRPISAPLALLILAASWLGTAHGELIFRDGFEDDLSACPAPVHFASGLSPTEFIHVATTGSNASGDGSPGNPYATLARAAQDAVPGSAIVIHAGTYEGGLFIADLRGTAAQPIWVGGAEGEAPPLFSGGSNAIQFQRPAYLVLHDFHVAGSSANGINIDDGSDYGNPLAAHHVAIERLDIRDIGSTGNQDCLKISGLNDFWILDSSFENCGSGGSGIDFVGAHRGLVYGNTLTDIGSSGVQAKGGSEDIEIRGNRFFNGGGRALNMGGSTDFEFFRPPLSTTEPNAEARDIRAIANLFVGSAQAPLNFVGCVDCVAAHNTVIHPGSWLVRILQETTSEDDIEFEPASNGLLQNNLFLFRRSDIGSTAVNVSPNTDAASFVWQNNLFYATDQPAQSNPNAPGTVVGSLIGQDPLIGPPDYSIDAGSPAAGAGITYRPGLADLAGDCFATPPSIGAWEVP